MEREAVACDYHPPHTPPPPSPLLPPVYVLICQLVLCVEEEQEGGQRAEFQFQGGLTDFVQWLNSEKVGLSKRAPQVSSGVTVASIARPSTFVGGTWQAQPQLV